MASHTERAFEDAIEADLTGISNYESRNPSIHDETLALFPADVTGFLEESQSAKWQALEALLGARTAATVLDGLRNELEGVGASDRDGTEAAIDSLLYLDTTPRDVLSSEPVLVPSVLTGNIPK